MFTSKKHAAMVIEGDSSASLDFDHVTVAYNGKPALSDLTFQVQHGAQVAVVGPNGAGKSTLFKAIVGLLPLHTGQIHIHGRPLGSHLDCVAYVPQREEVDWRFPVTVADVVLMGRYGKLGWLRGPSRADHEIVATNLRQLGIADLASKSISDLSGGQQQRVFLARALAQEPHILLMDEPFTGVDITTQEATLALLDDLRKLSVTVLVSTHDLNLAATRFESVLLLNHRLVAFGPAAEIFTGETVRRAFGAQVYEVGGALVVDQCCGSHDESHVHSEPTE
ncbi:MAG: metal ABC transporter ATP-binding protein [Anaerolineae bacterium]